MTQPFNQLFDLITPDGKIITLNQKTRRAIIEIQNIPSHFAGFSIDKERVYFNLKSTLAQLGLHANLLNCELSSSLKSARVEIEFIPTDPIGAELLSLLEEGAYVGRLFAADERRRVREPYYLNRMFGRVDRDGSSLLSLGSLPGDGNLTIEKMGDHIVAYLTLLKGTYGYTSKINSLLPTIAEGLKLNTLKLRNLIQIHQCHNAGEERILQPNKQLLVRTEPLHVRTVFAKVVDELLPEGYQHTAANILEPTTKASGDIYELFGTSETPLDVIPLEFYTLEPYKEHVFFGDRDQLQMSLEDPEALFTAFATAPKPSHHKCATFVVKGEQLLNLQNEDWIVSEAKPIEYPGIFESEQQALQVQQYIEQQPSYPFLRAIEDGNITSQGILLARFFPSPVMKRMLLSDLVARCVKAIYFEQPSRSSGEYFSQEDRATLLDLAKFGIPVYWVDKRTKSVLLYTPKGDKDAGLFVPPEKAREFSTSTVFGIYGSNLLEHDLEEELTTLFRGLNEMKHKVDHKLLNPSSTMILVTGGGPGAMLVGNKAAKKAGILSCANVVDFSGENINEQQQNPYVEAKMTYRLEKLVERQAEFNLHFPIILVGGIGTDFEYCIEEVRRKTGVTEPTPIILFGPKEYWSKKITPRFLCNLESGTIHGSEWISNCFYCVENADAALAVYQKYFSGKLLTGPSGPTIAEGFSRMNID